MITNLTVNGLELTVEYDLEVTPVYLGDLESSYIDLSIIKVLWLGVDIFLAMKAFDLEETLKLIIQDRFEDLA
jgi:ABC-type tungstate transport system substrate-binding protein